MRGTAKLSCGHWIVYLDSSDEPPEHGPWSLWPQTIEIIEGMPVTCMVHLTQQRIESWFPGKWLGLNDRGVPT